MSDFKNVLATVATIAVGATLVTSGFLTFLEQEKVRKHRAATVIQNWYRDIRINSKELPSKVVYAPCKQHQHQQDETSSAVATIECRTIHRLAIVIQKWCKKNKNIQKRKHYVVRYRAAYLIQKWYRNRKSTSRLQQYDTKRSSVLKIEKWWKLINARLQILQYLLLNHDVAINQKWYGNHLKRKTNSGDLRNSAASVIQTCFKRHRKRRAMIRYIFLHANAMIIQQWYLNLRKRKYILHYLHLNNCAKLLQSWYKRNKKRKSILHYLHCYPAALVIQNWIRTCFIRTSIMYHAHRLAAVKAIQKWYCDSLKRENIMRFVLTIRSSVYSEGDDGAHSKKPHPQHSKYPLLKKWCQSTYKRKLILDNLEKENAAIQIQRWYRNLRKPSSDIVVQSETAQKLRLSVISEKEERESCYDIKRLKKYNNIDWIWEMLLDAWKRYKVAEITEQALEEILEDTVNVTKYLVSFMQKSCSRCKEKLSQIDAEVIDIISERANQAWIDLKELVEHAVEEIKNWVKRTTYDPRKEEEEIGICKSTKVPTFRAVTKDDVVLDYSKVESSENFESDTTEVRAETDKDEIMENKVEDQNSKIKEEMNLKVLQESLIDRSIEVCKEKVKQLIKDGKSDVNSMVELNAEAMVEPTEMEVKMNMLKGAAIQPHVARDTDKVEEFMKKIGSNSNVLEEFNNSLINEQKLTDEGKFDLDAVKTFDENIEDLVDTLKTDVFAKDGETVRTEDEIMEKASTGLVKRCAGCELLNWYNNYKRIRNLRRYFVADQAALIIQQWYRRYYALRNMAQCKEYLKTLKMTRK